MNNLDELIAEAHAIYRDARPISAALHERAKRVMPGGNTRSVLEFAPFPFRVVEASGAELIDVDGHCYVDFLGDYTAGLLGHSPGPIREAVIEALEHGWSFGATHEREIELAELVSGRFASIEQVRFTNSGTEANLMAIATALHHTGRSGVMVFENGYHGGVLSFRKGHDSALNVKHDYIRIEFNSTEAVEAAFHERGSTIGCVVVEPVQGSAGCIPGDDDFLRRLRELCSDHGAVLIFDEVMTSRLSPGGAQQLYSVTPDMTTLGKYIGGGMTFGAFGGRRSIMSAFDPGAGGKLTQAGTFNNNVVSMAAAVATLRNVLTSDALRELNDRGDRLRRRLGEALAGAPGTMRVTGIGSMLAVHTDDDRYLELFFHAMIADGHYLARRGFIGLSIAITDTHTDALVNSATLWSNNPLLG